MAMIGIVSAMQQELSAVLAQLQVTQCVKAVDRLFWLGHWQGHSVVVVLSRIGKVAAATTATVLLERFPVDALVFTGVAGGLGAGVRVGDVVVASTFVQHDMDASPLFPKHEVPLYDQSEFATHGDLSAQLAFAALQVLGQVDQHLGLGTRAQFGMVEPKVHQGLVISGDRFVTTAQEAEALRLALPGVLAVEMEGAAVAQVCHDYQVPFAAVRTVSDRADEQAAVDFNRFIEDVASRYSLAVLSQWLSARPIT